MDSTEVNVMVWKQNDVNVEFVIIMAIIIVERQGNQQSILLRWCGGIEKQRYSSWWYECEIDTQTVNFGFVSWACLKPKMDLRLKDYAQMFTSFVYMQSNCLYYLGIDDVKSPFFLISLLHKNTIYSNSTGQYFQMEWFYSYQR